MVTFTLEQLAGFLGGQASESPGPEIAGVRPIEHAGEKDITYVANARFLQQLAQSSAGAVIVPPNLDPGSRPHIRSGNPEAAFARLTALYYPYPAPPAGVSSKAEVHPECTLGQDVSVGPYAVLGKGAVVGDRSVIGPHVVVGEHVEIGEETRIFPNVTIYPRVRIGRRVIIHSGAVIGSDGFGFARDQDHQGNFVNVKKYQSGTVEIEDDAEIGALCAVDRALAGATRIGKGVKLDNLIQIAHNVSIGDGTVIASQSGIAGSSSVGRFGMIGGQVGVRDHVRIGDGVILATRVGIYRNVPDGSVMAGSVPAMPHSVFLRVQSLFKRLPEILERIRKLENLVLSNRKEVQ
ncbi:MAG: UDP-3-O-(3-hydroxymyristoyl)glucosamine N-acyltransferase [Desulfomonile tiedjei]|nr:UDP-3-O-(3-hydroxymyristoyl)glucosamine N-acyltransferase [Desulfomonile tiedjei]